MNRKVMILALVLVNVFFLYFANPALAAHPATPFHPGLPVDEYNCERCHNSAKFNAFVCNTCHGTNVAAPNLTSYAPPDPPVVKYDSPGQPTIHSNYTRNTDACASCHSTHTAAGPKLIKWPDSTTGCLACHDGTVAVTYDVKRGLIGATGAKTAGGKFGVTLTEPGLSYHNIFDVVTTSAAPGGAETNTVSDRYGIWNTPFDCNACHTPHGQGGNGRLLKPDPNGIATQNRVTGETLTVAVPNVKYSAAKNNWIPGYPYASVTKIYAGAAGTTPVTSGYTIDYSRGEVTFNPPLSGVNVVKADYVPGLSVKLTVNNKLTATESVSYDGGMNKFCGACHTDYETSAMGSTSGQTKSGVYRSAYRHGVGMLWDDKARETGAVTGGVLKFENAADGKGTIMCLTCHFAHGTDDAFIGDATADMSRLTALKRQVNMGVCQTCHQK